MVELVLGQSGTGSRKPEVAFDLEAVNPDLTLILAVH